jgi:FAD/FMN-containing dehydrogenase
MGTLGLITEVTFKVQPLPVGRASWIAQFPSDHAEGFKLLSAVHAINLPLERLDLNLCSGAATFLVQAAGTTKELDRIDAELRACATAGSSSSAGKLTRTQNETNWNTATTGVQNAPVSVAPAVTLRFWSFHSKLESVYNAVASIKAPESSSLCPNGGRIEFSSIDAATFARIASAITALGANYRCENIRGLRIDAPYGPPRPDVALMRKIKESLDPQGIFNAGRFVV